MKVSKNVAPKIGFLDRLKIAFSDEAAVARVIAVTEAIDANAKSSDPNLCEQSAVHIWNGWSALETWERTNTKTGAKQMFFKQRRKCTRCGIVEERAVDQH